MWLWMVVACLRGGADLDGDGYSVSAGDCDDNDASLNLDDLDEDGFNTCQGDCDDLDPLRWNQRGNVIPGNVTEDDLPTLCQGWCESRVDGNVVVKAFPGTDLQVLDCLSEVAGDFQMLDANSLATVDGLENLREVGGNVRFEGNLILDHIDGLSGLTTVGGDLEFVDNPIIGNLAGLAALESVGGSLVIADSFRLLDLQGLEGSHRSRATFGSRTTRRC